MSDITPTYAESQLIGNILHDTEDDQSKGNPTNTTQPTRPTPIGSLGKYGGPTERPSSAPPTMYTTNMSQTLSLDNQEKYRGEAWYYEYYHNQRPADPRLLPPLLSQEQYIYQRSRQEFSSSTEPNYKPGTSPQEDVSKTTFEQPLDMNLGFSNPRISFGDSFRANSPLGTREEDLLAPKNITSGLQSSLTGSGLYGSSNGLSPMYFPEDLNSSFSSMSFDTKPLDSGYNGGGQTSFRKGGQPPPQSFGNYFYPSQPKQTLYEGQQTYIMHRDQSPNYYPQPDFSTSFTNTSNPKVSYKPNFTLTSSGNALNASGSYLPQYLGSTGDLAPTLTPLTSSGSSPNIPTNSTQPSNPGKNGHTRSVLLEEFRNSKSSRKFDLKDLVGYFVEFSGDQHGSRFIQQKLENASASDKQLVFKEIQPHALQLMTDVFGNYVIQKFFDYGTDSQKKALGEVLTGNVLSLSLQMYGCRVVQKALEAISDEQQSKVVKELDGHVLKCIKDQNGNHVIQKVIEQVRPELVLFIIETFQEKVYSLATHPYGCRVIQRILEHCSNPQKRKHVDGQLNITDHMEQLKQELLKSTASLVQDQYGNYVIQHVLEHGKQEDKCQIVRNLKGHIFELSKHKFASNVIEKCVQYGGGEERQLILEEIVGLSGNYDKKGTASGTALEAMMKDQYANYVIQKILDVCDNNQRDLLITHIKPHVVTLKKFTYGKHIIARLEKLIGRSL